MEAVRCEPTCCNVCIGCTLTLDHMCLGEITTPPNIIFTFLYKISINVCDWVGEYLKKILQRILTKYRQYLHLQYYNEIERIV